MEDSEVGDIFHEDRYYDDDDDGHQKKTEDARKSDKIKDNEESEDDEDDDDESDDGSENEDGSKKKKKKKKANLLKEKKKTKRKVDIFRFKPDMLTNQERGIKFLYENIEKAKIFDKNEKGIFDELKALDKLVNYYKGWHFHFMPKYSYQYFLDRCTEFGKASLIKTYMNNVRRIHKGELQWKDLVDQLETENQQNENDPNNPKVDSEGANQAAGSSKAQVQDKNKNNQSFLNDTNLSRTIDSNVIPKNIKDIYLPQNKLSKSNKVNESSYARSNDVSRNPIQSQDMSSYLDKNSLSQNQIKKNNSQSKDHSTQEYYEDEQLNKIQEYDDELRILQEEIDKQQKILEELDQQNYNEESDEVEDIKIKRKQADD